jgi:thioredoxin 1
MKVDVDANEAFSTKHGITAMPTFLAFKDGKEVKRMTGADEGNLRRLVQDLLAA